MNILLVGIDDIMSFDVWSKKQIINYHSIFKIDRKTVIDTFIIIDNKLMTISCRMSNIFTINDEKITQEDIKRVGTDIRYIEEASQDFQMLAVNQNGFSIQYLINPSKEVCIEALYQNPKSIPFIDIEKWPDLYNLYVLLIR